MDRDQHAADAAEDRAIERLRFLRDMRSDPWVRRIVALALAVYLTFFIATSGGPVQHRPPSCLVLPSVARPNC